MWTPEDLKDFAEAYGRKLGEDSHATQRDAFGAVASLAVEKVAVRGGTMTAEQVAELAMSGLDEDVRIVEHISAQGARVAWFKSRMEREAEAALHWRQRVEKAADALSDVATGDLGRLDLVGRIEWLKAQLPEGMKRCTIVFKECALGHGRLTATNWVDHGCDTCERDSLRADLARLNAQLAERETLLAGFREREATYTEALARIKPSGQVAEDKNFLLMLAEDSLPSDVMPDFRTALLRLAAGAQEAEALRAKVAELERVRHVAEGRLGHTVLERDEANATIRQMESAAERDARLDSENHERFQEVCSEVERLKAELVDVKRARWDIGERLKASESRLAAIREKLSDAKIDEWMDAPHDPEPHSDDALLRAFARHLEGDAPQEAKPLCGAAHPSDPSIFCMDNRGHDGPHSDTGDGPALTWRRRDTERYPCSDTCTHDDAATPGHPERVRERSGAVNSITFTRNELDNFRHDAEEAMRAACLEAVKGQLQVFAMEGGLFEEAIKKAIEGAAP